MGYYNPIYIYGVDRFLADAKAAGVDGLIVVDLPPEEDEELCLPALAAGHQLHPPGDADHRRQAPADGARRTPRGFVYYVSIAGITGTKAPRPPKRRRPRSTRIKRHTDSAGRRRLRRQDRRAGARPSPQSPMRVVVGSALVDAVADSLDSEPARPRAGDRSTPVHVRWLRARCARGVRGADAMNWITNFVRPKIRSHPRRKREVPDNLWIKCPRLRPDDLPPRSRGQPVRVCRARGHHMRIGAATRASKSCSTSEPGRRSRCRRSPPIR